MKIEEIESIIAEAIVNNSDEQLQSVEKQEDLGVLGLNSISFIKLVVGFEEMFGVEFEDEYLDFGVLNNVEKLALYIKERINEH